MFDFNDLLTHSGGKLYWKEWKQGRRRDLVAGSQRKSGYVVIGINGELLYAHRVCWEMHHGEIPDGFDVDHINHKRNDNRIENLRVVRRVDNLKNKGVVKSNTGVMGVYWNKKTSRFTANIGVNGKIIHIGSFYDLESARQARVEAQVRYGFHENHGIDG